MKIKLFSTLLVAALSSAPVHSNTTRGSDATLEVVVTGVRSSRGFISVGIHDDATAWPKKGKVVMARYAPAQTGTVRLTFKGLRPGAYAVATFHDENANRELDTNMLGMPSEGYGFSGEGRAVFGPPDFEDAKFKFGREAKTVSLKMGY